MPAPQYVTIAQALLSSQTGLLVQDTAANIAAALPNSALTARVASFSLSANASIAAAAADTLATLGAKFQPGAAHILVQDTVAAMNAAANAAGLALATSRGIVDAAYNLLAAPAADFTNIATVTLTGSPTLSMLQLAKLEALPSFSVQAGAAVLLQDSLADFVPVLSAHAAWFSSASALSVRLDGSQIGAAGVTALAALASAGKTLSFVAGATDTTLNITAAAHDLAAAAASVNQLGGLVALHITLSNDGTAVTAADAVALDSIVGYAPSAHTLTIADTAAAIAANAAALFGHGYPQIAVTSGNFTGTAAQLLDPTLQFQGAATATLTGSPTLSMAQLTRLETLPSFSVQGGAHVLLQDALTNFVPVLSAHAAWFAGASALSVRLDGGVIGAAGVTALAALETAGKTLTFVAGATDTTLNITAAAHDLATAAASVNQLGGLVGLHVTISNDGSAVTAADAVALDSITGFSAAAHTLTVADTATAIGANAAALFGHGYPQIAVASGDFIGTAAQLLDPTLAFQGNATATLTGNAAVNAAQAQSLAALPGFTLAGGATLAVADTITSLLADAGSLGAATTITATDSETVSASNAIALAVIAAAHSGHFSLGGNTLTVLDTAANLAALPQTAIALATGFALSAPATVNAAQFVTLRDTLHVGLNGQAITIDDSASHLLGLSGSLGLASACVLTGSAMVSASALQTLAGDPGFSTGGYALGVSDTAANLIALSQPLQLIAGSLTLSGPQSVSASQLAALVGLGAKFTTDGYALTVTGSAADLASLNAPELALIHAAQLTQSATIGASAATALAILPNFTVGHLATLTVQDSAANLLGLPAGVLTQATEELPAGPVTLTAATAAGLAGLAHFTAIGAAITVSDTIANLTAAQNSGWQGIAGATQVVDSAAHLVAGASSALVQQAGGVAVSANASISAAQAAILNTIPNFGGGSFALTVVDGAAAIAANEAAIAHVAATATVSDSGPVNTAQADTLALLSGAGKLTFLGGDQLVVADSYGNLVAGGNTAGVALANSLTVIDTAANLITASAHDWGSKAPTYELNDNEVVTGPQATALAALGAHFSLNTHTLAVADGAAAVAAAAPALASLGITASVTDSALNIGANIVALQGLGAELTHVQTTDITPVLGATAAALAPLAGKLTGSPLAVQDTAAGVDTSLAGLIALGAHVAVTVHDSATAIGADATALATLGAAITVSLTDGAPVLAATAAALSPLAAHLQDGTLLAITDTGAATAAAAAALLALNASLGTITLSDGYSLTVAQAVALQPLDGHLPAGPLVTINGDAADIAANHAAIAAFVQDGHVAAVLDSNDTAAAVAANAPGLALAGATVTIFDTQANLMANIATLAQNATGILQSVTVNDTPHPVFTLSISQYSEDAPILSLVSNPHAIAVIDLASAIEADLNSEDPVLTGIPGLGAINTIGHAAVVLSQSAVLFPGNATVLAHLAAPLAVTGVDIAHLTAVAALNPASIVVSDTAADIQADLASGNPLLLAHLGALHGITVSPAGTITLTPAQVLAAGVDDGIGSVFAQMNGATLDVAGATIATVAPLLGLGVAPAAIAVSDTAAHITAALTDPASAILTAANSILSLHVTDGGRIVLTEAQDLAAGVNDSAHAALAKLSGTSIEVLGVAASQLAAVEATATLPDEINLSDTAAAITAALPALLTDLANLGAITITSGTVTLSYAQAIAAHVADGAGSLVSLLPGQSYAVAGVSLAQIASLAALAQPPASYAITDSSANLAADLTAQTSQWDAHGSLVTVQGGVLALTGAQADSIILSGRTADLHDLGAGQTVEITGVPVADLANLAAVSGALQNGVTLHLDVADTAANLGADLTGGSSVLTADAAFVNSVTLVTSNVPVTPAQLDLIAALPNLTAAILSVPVIGSAAAVDGMSQAALALAGPVSVSDTASNVQGALDTLQSVFHGGLTIHLTDATPFIGITSDTYAADQQTVDAIVNPGSVTVVGGAGAIAALEPLLAADRVVGAVQIIDSAFNVVENLPAIAALAGQATVFVTDIGAIPAYLAQALAGAGLAHLNAGLLTVLDSGSQIAAMAESGTAAQTFLAAHGAILAADSSVSLLDAQALNALGGALNRNGHAVNIWDTAAHLTQPGAAAAIAALIGGGLVTGIYLEAPNNAATLTAATAVALLAIPGLSIDNPDASVNIVTVADTAAHLDSNYASLDSDLASAHPSGRGCQRHGRRLNPDPSANARRHHRRRRLAHPVRYRRQYPGGRLGQRRLRPGQHL